MRSTTRNANGQIRAIALSSLSGQNLAQLRSRLNKNPPGNVEVHESTLCEAVFGVVAEVVYEEFADRLRTRNRMAEGTLLTWTLNWPAHCWREGEKAIPRSPRKKLESHLTRFSLDSSVNSSRELTSLIIKKFIELGIQALEQMRRLLQSEQELWRVLHNDDSLDDVTVARLLTYGRQLDGNSSFRFDTLGIPADKSVPKPVEVPTGFSPIDAALQRLEKLASLTEGQCAGQPCMAALKGMSCSSENVDWSQLEIDKKHAVYPDIPDAARKEAVLNVIDAVAWLEQDRDLTAPTLALAMLSSRLGGGSSQPERMSVAMSGIRYWLRPQLRTKREERARVLTTTFLTLGDSPLSDGCENVDRVIDPSTTIGAWLDDFSELQDSILSNHKEFRKSESRAEFLRRARIRVLADLSRMDPGDATDVREALLPNAAGGDEPDGISLNDWLVCDVADEFPARMLRIPEDTFTVSLDEDVDEKPTVTIGQWSELLIASLESAEENAATTKGDSSQYCPLWLGALALHHLNFPDAFIRDFLLELIDVADRQSQQWEELIADQEFPEIPDPFRRWLEIPVDEITDASSEAQSEAETQIEKESRPLGIALILSSTVPGDEDRIADRLPNKNLIDRNTKRPKPVLCLPKREATRWLVGQSGIPGFLHASFHITHIVVERPDLQLTPDECRQPFFGMIGEPTRVIGKYKKYQQVGAISASGHLENGLSRSRKLPEDFLG